MNEKEAPKITFGEPKLTDVPELILNKERVNRILLGRHSHLSEVSTEQSLRESDAYLLKRHNESFVNLLSNYVESSNVSQKHKRRMKIFFFGIIMFIITVLSLSFVAIILFGLYMQSKGNVKMLDLLVPIIASFSSVIISIYVLPKIIAEYLFDKREDDRLSNIVSNMQEYDKEIRKHQKNTVG